MAIAISGKESLSAAGSRPRPSAQACQAASRPIGCATRISEFVAWTRRVIRRDDGKVQLNVLGKGSKPLQVLLPEVVSNALRRLRGDSGDDASIFANRAGGPLTDRAVNYMRLIRELMASGYWIRMQERTATGGWGPVEMIFTDDPPEIDHRRYRT